MGSFFVCCCSCSYSCPLLFLLLHVIVFTFFLRLINTVFLFLSLSVSSSLLFSFFMARVRCRFSFTSSMYRSCIILMADCVTFVACSTDDSLVYVLDGLDGLLRCKWNTHSKLTTVKRCVCVRTYINLLRLHCGVHTDQIQGEPKSMPTMFTFNKITETIDKRWTHQAKKWRLLQGFIR